ncbi:hypothetical protein DGG96_13220 [Legionella qingyii]|uniref:Uncharacterized protein n=1 Tax=Legionella qingyii TaxID=2184757 RepID=A0A317U300_9GAMM|nr:hypothetical protein DGG96_13220 [Legionella qingyii]
MIEDFGIQRNKLNLVWTKFQLYRRNQMPKDPKKSKNLKRAMATDVVRRFHHYKYSPYKHSPFFPLPSVSLKFYAYK